MLQCRQVPLVVALCALAAIAGTLLAQDKPGKKQPADPPGGASQPDDPTEGDEPEPAEQPVEFKKELSLEFGKEAEEPEEGQRSVVLPDNGDLRRKLELVRQQIEGERYADAARELGQFLQNPEIHDFFLSHDKERRQGRSFLAEVRRMLHDLPPAGLVSYRAQFDAPAQTWLNAAIAAGDESSLRDVAARFPETKAGDEALFRLGRFLWDHGRPQAAAACLERLHNRPDAAGPFEPALSLQLAACWGRAGDREKSLAVMARLRKNHSDAAPQIAGVKMSDLATEAGWAGHLTRIAPSKPEDASLGDWMTFRGNATRNGSAPVRAPFLAARWSRATATDPATQLEIDRAWDAYRRGFGTSFPLLNPLAVGNLIFVRTSRGVAAFDLESGACRWRSPSDDEGENSGLDQLVWREPGGGAFALDDECVYFLETARIDDSGEDVPSENVLTAREHFGGRQGNLRWEVGGRDGGMEPRLAGMFFLGPPLAWQWRLYLMAESKGALALVALDRVTGRLTWSQDVALVEQGISADLVRLVGGATPSISADEIIVCPTSGGAVVALDLTTQSLLWAYRYVRKPPESAMPVVDDSDTVPRIDQFDRWLDGTVSIGAGRVVVTPCESREIHCLDLHEGRLLWTQPRDDGMYVACLTGDQAVVVGRKAVRAHSLNDGKIAWTVALPDGAFPAGRGILAQGRYLLPVTSASVLDIDLSRGAVAAEHKSPREVPPGNLIWHRGLVVSQSPQLLEVFDERERLITEVDAALKADSRNTAALVRKGELESAAGHTAEAIVAFRAAHASAPSPRTKTRLISALLEGVRRNLPDSDELSAELDRMIGP